MRSFPFYIAKRYLFAKKSTNAINVISAVSVIGVAVATMALVVTLSVFNGFHDMVATFFTALDPQLKVVPVTGKTAKADDPVLAKIRQLPQIDVATECVEDQALAIYNGRQAMVTVKGVGSNFAELTHITDILYGDGKFSLEAANLQYGTIGIRLAEDLGTGARWDGYMHILGSSVEIRPQLHHCAHRLYPQFVRTRGKHFVARTARESGQRPRRSEKTGSETLRRKIQGARPF